MKSQIIGIILALFTGPIGLLYSSFLLFFIMTILIVLAVKEHVPSDVFLTIWLSCVPISIWSVSKHNKENTGSSSSSHSNHNSSTNSSNEWNYSYGCRHEWRYSHVVNMSDMKKRWYTCQKCGRRGCDVEGNGWSSRDVM